MKTLFSGKLTLPRASRYDSRAGNPAERFELFMRLDKYLKVSRLIKRRTVANEACDNTRVTVNGKPAKASYDVKVGDHISIAFGARSRSSPWQRPCARTTRVPCTARSDPRKKTGIHPGFPRIHVERGRLCPAGRRVMSCSRRFWIRRPPSSRTG